jgi:hypothetical protein
MKTAVKGRARRWPPSCAGQHFLVEHLRLLLEGALLRRGQVEVEADHEGPAIGLLRERPAHRLRYVHRESRCIRRLPLRPSTPGRCRLLASTRDLGLRAPPTLRFESCSGRLPSTGQVGAPDDRLTALAMVPLHLLERPRHRPSV